MEDIQIVMEWYNKLTKILLGLGMFGAGVSIYLFFHFRIYQMLSDRAGRSIRRSIRKSSRRSERGRRSGNRVSARERRGKSESGELGSMRERKERSGSGKMVFSRQGMSENSAGNQEPAWGTEENDIGATVELSGKSVETDTELWNKTEDKGWIREKIVLIHTSQRITESGRLVNE